MAIQIAGRQVLAGDKLHYRQGQVVGTVVKVENTTGYLSLPNALEPLLFGQGGVVRGKRQLYWHPQLTLDLPVADISKYQCVVDALVEAGL